MADSCSRCAADLADFDGAMGMSLHGFGDRGIIDTFNMELDVALCEECSRHMFEAEPWLLGAASPALNINYGHECLDGSIHWVPESKCPIDPDRHGWVLWYAVAPHMSRPRGRRAPLVTPSGKTARYGVFKTPAEAAALAEELQTQGIPCRTTEVLSGNARNHGAIVEPGEWLTWWERYDKQWLRAAKLRAVRDISRAFARRPLSTTWFFIRQALR